MSNTVVPRAAYHVAIKFDGQTGRVVAHYRTVVPPYVDVKFPLPDTYKHGQDLEERDDALLALMFNQIVQNAYRSIAQMQQQQQLALPATVSATQAVLADMEDEIELNLDADDPEDRA